ncbi:MAG: AAA family ATPase [Deltaproteobacteria bacterium]|nr:AAA family ATPase [Deltaproteobacteria bacterium]
MKQKRHEEEVRGRVARLYYSSPKFSAGVLTADGDKRVKFKGSLVVQEGDRVVLFGRWVDHPQYGRQLDVARFETDMEFDQEGLARFLEKHPDIKGIGPVKAKLIAARFGDDFERALEERLEELADVAKIKIETARLLRDMWNRTKTLNKAMTWLASFGLTYYQMTRIIENLGNNAVALLKENPYILLQSLRGFGFRRVDQVALKMGIKKDFAPRIRTGLIYCVDEALGHGNCWVMYDALIDQANRLLVIDSLDAKALIEHELGAVIADGELAMSVHMQKFLIAKPQILEMEKYLAERFFDAAAPNPHRVRDDELGALVSKVGPTLNAAQRKAVETALTRSVSVVSGAAGSGKSFLVGAIVRAYEARDLTVALAAPTGKAAKRIEQVVGRPASTVHRLLGYDGNEFQFNEAMPLPADMVVIDEVSMVDVTLAYQLFKAIDPVRTAVVLAGDHNQLPPVGPGAVLRDLIHSDVVPVTILDTVVRQAGELRLNSAAVLDGKLVRPGKNQGDGPKPWVVVDTLKDAYDCQAYVLKLFDEVIEAKLGFNLSSDVQLLTPTHKGPLGTRELNVLLQRLMQKKLWGVDIPETKPGARPRLYPRDKVIQTRNNYDLDVMNGTVGYVVDVDKGGGLVLFFEGETVEIPADTEARLDIELAYCLTIHKTQGSEFPCAVAVVHKSHSFQHHRNLLYTAVTRAQKTAVIVGDRWGIQNCVGKEQTWNRASFLPFLFGEGR